MGKKTAWRLALIAALVAIAGLLAHAGLVALQGSPPASPPQQAPAAATAVPAAREPSPEAAAEPRSGQMRMAEAPKTFTPSPSAAADYSDSLKKPRERTIPILPGVTYSTGNGVSVKTANKDETIRITRDSTYPNTDYQVLWQKKY